MSICHGRPGDPEDRTGASIINFTPLNSEGQRSGFNWGGFHRGASALFFNHQSTIANHQSQWHQYFPCFSINNQQSPIINPKAWSNKIILIHNSRFILLNCFCFYLSGI